jgi:hypothetical protein
VSDRAKGLLLALIVGIALWLVIIVIARAIVDWATVLR